MSIYELRTYAALPGRLPDLLARFEHHTIGIWNRLGIRPYGFWTPLTGPSSNDLIYYLVWESLAQREVLWQSFVQDPEWLDVRHRSEADGPILANIASQFLAPTAFAQLGTMGESR
ncbi:NIPSNAP family protein [Ensifer adhaerens]|uniref:NIPSNAP family protein n=1 Tax=Ensifer adhaerens TaxID=106592 RepID=UPI000FDBE29A|nr:NIPSNAP family protein [Ensifer adhaerens]MDF8357600.1 NIPSNAP family protein [Ensifer adhaerens]THA57088.1 NIPSNAP family protein [Ensifer adhaerens]